MKRIFILVLLSLLLCACSEDKFNTFSYAGETITIGKAIDNENYHVEDGKLYFNDKYIGTVIMEDDKLIGLDVYLYDVKGDICLNGYLLTKSVKETCDYFGGKVDYKKGAVCIINEDGDNGTSTMVFYANIYDQVIDELNRISMYKY